MRGTPQPVPAKVKPQPSATGPQLVPTREQLIDEFGELDRLVNDFKPKAKRHEALKEIIRGWYCDQAAEQEFEPEGRLYRLQVSACENRSTVSPLKVYKDLGVKKLLQICEITLKAIKEAVGESAAAKYVTYAQTGSRKITAVAKAAPAPPAAA